MFENLDKKKLYIGLTFVIVLGIAIWSYAQSLWKEVEINTFDKITIPTDWTVTDDGGRLYFSNKAITEADVKIYVSNELPENYKYIEEEVAETYNNGASYGKAIFEVDGKQITKRYITLYTGVGKLLIWDDQMVTDGVAAKMAESYIQR